ncbi:hypothetical protein [Aureibacillus halotolerans]|nr:hypothetical protein [Aureibacillus halotolerans]
MAKRRKWILLKRYEDGYAVHIYEPLLQREIGNKLRQGWTIVK